MTAATWMVGTKGQHTHGLKLLVLFICSLLAMPSPAQLDVLPTPREVNNAGGMELAGAVEIQVFDPAFFDASPQNPHYIRIALPTDIVLAETLVDIAGDPIYLALHTLFPGLESVGAARPSAS